MSMCPGTGSTSCTTALVLDFVLELGLVNLGIYPDVYKVRQIKNDFIMLVNYQDVIYFLNEGAQYHDMITLDYSNINNTVQKYLFLSSIFAIFVNICICIINL